MPGTVRKTARLLKDSGRYLLAGVRAALAEPVDATRELLESWRAGSRELVLAPGSPTKLVSDAMAEVTIGCAQLGIDLLLEQVDKLPEELPMDQARMAAALETTLHTAMREFGQDATIRVRTLVRDWRVVIEAVADRPAALERLQARLTDPMQDPALAVEIVRAHGGELVARGDADSSALVIELPLG